MPALSNVTENKPLMLKKHSALVSMRGHLSQVQHLAFDTMLCLAMPFPEQNIYTCSVPWLREKTGYTLGGKHSAAAFINEVRDITHIVIDIDDCDLLGKAGKVADSKDDVVKPAQELWKRSGLIASISTEAKNGVDKPTQALCTSFSLISSITLLDDNTIEYSFAPVMKKFCFSPLPYAEINLAQTLKLKKAALALMGICIDFSGASIPQMPFHTLRDMLGCGDTYRDDSAFLRHCFEPAARVVGERLCMNISLEVKKKTRKRIDTVKLRMTKNYEVAGGAETELTPEGLLELVPEKKWSQTLINVINHAVAQGYELDRIASNIIYVMNYTLENDPVRLLRKAIDVDFTKEHRANTALLARQATERAKTVARAARRGAAASAKAAKVTKAEQGRQMKVFLGYSGERLALTLAFCKHLGAVSLPEMLAYYFSHLDEFTAWLAEEKRLDELASSADVNDIFIDDGDDDLWSFDFTPGPEV